MKFDKLVNRYLCESDQQGPLYITTHLSSQRKPVKCYYKDPEHTIRHRVDGPAVEWSDGSEEWWVNGKRHRLDGPAEVKSGVFESWWVNGKRHRVDGPAWQGDNGHKEWYINGKRHREDGPAVVFSTGQKYYYIHGKQITEHEFKNYLKKQKVSKEIQSHKNNRIDPGMLEDYL